MGRHAVFWTLRDLPNVQKGRRNLPVSKLTGHSCIPPWRLHEPTCYDYSIKWLESQSAPVSMGKIKKILTNFPFPICYTNSVIFT